MGGAERDAVADRVTSATRAEDVVVDEAAMLDFLARLVRERSVHDPDRGTSEASVAEVVAEEMRALGWAPVVEEAAPGRPNVIAVLDGGRPGPTLMFEGHTDVVTEGDADAWTHPPFGATVVDGRLYGRGAADMKAGVAAMVYAAAAVARAGFGGRIVVAALADEEGMMLGAKHFARTPLARQVDAAIVCEPEAGEVCVSQKGAIRLLVRAHGRMAHGAMPDHGRNPIAALALLTDRLSLVQRELQDEHAVHPQLGTCYVTPTVMAAGSTAQLNVIPAFAELGVDIRTIPGVDHEALLQRVRSEAAAITAATEVRFEVEVVDDRPATDMALTEPVVQAVIAAHREVTGEEPVIGGVPGATDGTILWRDAGVPFVTYGPGGKWIAHQVDEFVELADVVTAARVYVAAARRFLAS